MAAWQELEWVSEHLHPKGGVGSDEDEARLAEIFRTCHGDQNLIGQFMYLEVSSERTIGWLTIKAPQPRTLGARKSLGW